MGRQVREATPTHADRKACIVSDKHDEDDLFTEFIDELGDEQQRKKKRQHREERDED